MKKALNLANHVLLSLLFFGLVAYVKVKYFYQLPYYTHFFFDILSISFVYLYVQPVFINVFHKYRRWVIYGTTGISFILSMLWNFEYAYFTHQKMDISIYFIPIIFATVFLSVKIGLGLTAMASISHILMDVGIHEFEFNFIVTGILLGIIHGLVVILLDKVIKQRDRFANKRNLLVQESNALIIGVNEEGKIDICNKKMLEFLELTEKETLGQYFWKVKPSIKKKEALEIFNLLIEEKPVENAELELTINKENHYFILDTYSLRDDGFTNGRMISLKNITERKEMERKLHELSVKDELTGMYNRRYFQSKFEEEIIRSERYQHDLSLIMIDLDHFKQVNDTYGHVAGDYVLKEVGRAIESSIRRTDISARLGGEELAVLLPETKQSDAYEVAERIRLQIMELEFEVEQGVFRVTASLGVTTQSEGFVIEQMMEEADKALYSAKESGRNKVVQSQKVLTSY
ncbi:diguanylate cyclase [Paenibacillus septentrionalis]|uniref:Diguanylate cyclase n=1 Tax=Paenibacillus septentrionalis TaxID=429342 RepID=A0ABW1V5U6_9BACL